MQRLRGHVELFWCPKVVVFFIWNCHLCSAGLLRLVSQWGKTVWRHKASWRWITGKMGWVKMKGILEEGRVEEIFRLSQGRMSLVECKDEQRLSYRPLGFHLWSNEITWMQMAHTLKHVCCAYRALVSLVTCYSSAPIKSLFCFMLPKLPKNNHPA